jgi:site-specific DNA-cytosine methylase
MGTLRQAMHDLNIKVDNYYSSEIKPYAIELQQYHFQDVIQVGDINNWKQWDIDWKTIDFIGSGSPCQDLSIAGNRAGINGSKSNLFFVFIEILNHVKKLNPNVLFLQENVGSANKTDIGIMSRELGVYPVRINSNLLTAQNRDRYYWTNIRTKNTMFDLVTDIPQPKDKKIFIKDIIESGYVETEKANAILESQSRPVTSQESILKRDKKGFITAVREATKKGFIEVKENECVDLSYPKSETRRGRLMKDKSNALLRKNEYYLNKGEYLRQLTQTELERLQGFSDGYTSILSYNKASSLLGDGWTLPIIKHILSFLNGFEKANVGGKKEKRCTD